MAGNTLDIRPLSGTIGAEILGIDLTHEVNDETIAAIRAAWLEHLVVFFRGQSLEPAQLLSVAKRFGEPVEYPFVKGPVEKIGSVNARRRGVKERTFAFLRRAVFDRFGRS